MDENTIDKTHDLVEQLNTVLCLVMKSVALAMESEKLMFGVVTI